MEIQLVESLRLAPDIGDQRPAVQYIMLAALEASVSSERRIFTFLPHFDGGGGVVEEFFIFF